MSTIIERAKVQIKGFTDLSHRLERDIILNGKSRKTFNAYIGQIASIALYFKKLPFDVSDDQIAEFLFQVKTENRYSETYFKFTVYGLRYIFKLYGYNQRKIDLPSIPHEKTLPVILSQQECKQLISLAKTFRDKFLLALIYSAGLRMGEAQRLEKNDIDCQRMLLHIRQGKGKKDRYVVLSKLIANRFDKYCNEYKITKYVFAGQKPGHYISETGMRRILKAALKTAAIEKDVCLHSLRHCFATHLLENGTDIITVKEQLGHEDIQTTMRYLQVANMERTRSISPLDSLYNIK
jgi:site-specific recombinase XerD